MMHMTLNVLMDTIDTRALAALVLSVKQELACIRQRPISLKRGIALARCQEALQSLMYAWERSEGHRTTPEAFAEAWDTFLATVDRRTLRDCGRRIHRSLKCTLKETRPSFAKLGYEMPTTAHELLPV